MKSRVILIMWSAVCIMCSMSACSDKQKNEEVTMSTTELTEITTETIETSTYVSIGNVSVDELENAMQILSDEYVNMAKYVKKGMKIYDGYMLLGTDIKNVLIDIREVKNSNADDDEARMALTNTMDEIAVKMYGYAEDVGYDISFENNTNGGINPNGFYAGKSDDEILNYGVSAVSKNKFADDMDINIGEALLELAKISGSQGQWSGTIGDDDSLIVEYSTSDGENFYNMKFDVKTDGTSKWQCVSKDSEEITTEEFVLHLKELIGD